MLPYVLYAAAPHDYTSGLKVKYCDSFKCVTPEYGDKSLEPGHFTALYKSQYVFLYQ